jgi:DNA-binding MarR family transcriptional regulator
VDEPIEKNIPPRKSNPRHIGSRWTEKLAETGWTPIVDAFLDHYGKLGISNPEAMFLVHLLRYKWDSEMPFPGFNGIAEKMQVTDTSVRKYARDLESRGFLRRVDRPGRTSAFDLSPLFAALERELKRIEDAEQGTSKSRRRSVRITFSRT